MNSLPVTTFFSVRHSHAKQTNDQHFVGLRLSSTISMQAQRKTLTCNQAYPFQVCDLCRIVALWSSVLLTFTVGSDTIILSEHTRNINVIFDCVPVPSG